MKSINIVGWTILVMAVYKVSSGEQEQTAVRQVYNDGKAVLQTWQDQKRQQLYLLSGEKLGLTTSLAFNGNALTEANVSLGNGTSIAVHSVGERFVTSLTQIGPEGRVFMLHDLDSDGSWDVRIRMPRKSEILLGSEWREATELSGLLSDSPKAVVDGIQYAFSGGTWKALVNKDTAR